MSCVRSFPSKVKVSASILLALAIVLLVLLAARGGAAQTSAGIWADLWASEWSTEIIIDPQAGTLADFLGFQTDLTVVYSLATWDFASHTEFDDTGWTDHTFEAGDTRRAVQSTGPPIARGSAESTSGLPQGSGVADSGQIQETLESQVRGEPFEGSPIAETKKTTKSEFYRNGGKSSGKLKVKSVYEGKTLLYTYEYEYHDNGKVKKITLTTYENGKKKRQRVSEYCSHGKLKKRTWLWYDINEKLTKKTEYVYDMNEDVERQTWWSDYDAQEKPKSNRRADIERHEKGKQKGRKKGKTFFRFDSKTGKWVKYYRVEYTYRTDGTYETITSVTFDASGNVVWKQALEYNDKGYLWKETEDTYKNGKRRSRIESEYYQTGKNKGKLKKRTWYTFDSKKKKWRKERAEEFEYDANGKPQSTTEFEFDADGNLKSSTKREMKMDPFQGSCAEITLSLPPLIDREIITFVGPSPGVLRFTDAAGAASDTDGDCLDQIATQMIETTLMGRSELLGPISLRLRDITFGEIEETENLSSGTLEIDPFAEAGEATSSFDIYFEVELLEPPAFIELFAPNLILLHNEDPVHVTSVIDHLVASPGAVYLGHPVQLYDQDENPVAVTIDTFAHAPDPSAEASAERCARAIWECELPLCRTACTQHVLCRGLIVDVMLEKLDTYTDSDADLMTPLMHLDASIIESFLERATSEEIEEIACVFAEAYLQAKPCAQGSPCMQE